MKTYLNNPMEGIPKMSNMYGMNPMMEMQSMYNMMQCMYHMMTMQSMYQMMNMQGSMYKIPQMIAMQNINPMMDGMNTMNSMTKIDMENDDNMRFPIPRLVKLEQISPTQVQITYDRDVDTRLGTKATNYWIKDTVNVRPEVIATLGKNDNVNAGNSLTDNMVRIDSKNGLAKTFVLTFNRVIPRGSEYMLIICYVTVKGAPPYSGDNGMATFIGE
ncbi:hypothetical protein [Clostridium sp.]|uniref:hypothetical protein n=1 Tax=Clostridium sp. TaxID=1506 RepID=UPI0026084E2D|nr:hypothetical protein [uncultured Clostridium sp.]